MQSIQIEALNTMLEATAHFASVGKVLQWGADPKNRTTLWLILWLVLLLILTIITAALVFGLSALTSSYRPGIAGSTALWAFSLAACALFFLPPKIITTMFGSLLGISVNEIGTASGLITKANEVITSLATQIGGVISGRDHPTDPFVGWMLWIFVIIFSLVCLPAFFRER
jgi:hypothetical protein